MKYITTLTFQIITLFSFGQIKVKPNENRLIINKDIVAQIEITNNCYPLDSCQIFTYKLNDSMMYELVDKLNKSNSIDPSKYYNLYSINIYLTDGNLRTFRSNGASIKENNDWCFNIKDSDYIENIWTELNKRSIQNSGKK